MEFGSRARFPKVRSGEREGKGGSEEGRAREVSSRSWRVHTEVVQHARDKGDRGVGERDLTFPNAPFPTDLNR